MEHDIYDSLRFIATTCEKMEDALNVLKAMAKYNGVDEDEAPDYEF